MTVATRDIQGTKRTEYRVEQLRAAANPERPFAEMLERLNELGKQGWHVVSMDLAHHASSSVGVPPAPPVPVLLMREIDQ